jgi:hypothetical protein
VFAPVFVAREAKTRDPPRPAPFRDDGSLYLREHRRFKNPYSSNGGASFGSPESAVVPSRVMFVICETPFVSYQGTFVFYQTTFVSYQATFVLCRAPFACHQVRSTANFATFVSYVVAFASCGVAFVSYGVALHSRGAPFTSRFSRFASRDAACGVGSGPDASRFGSR